jgi:hypothetical protein
MTAGTLPSPAPGHRLAAVLRRLALAVLHFARLVIVCSAVLGLAGAGYSVATGSDFHNAVVSALFIGGGVLFVVNAFAGGGTRGRMQDQLRWRSGHGASPLGLSSPFEWILVALALIGIGVLFVIL